MSTFRVVKHTHFAMVNSSTVRDDRLSFRALGVLTWLLDKPDDWRFTAESMSKGEGREGRDAIRNALRELETHGYIFRQKFQGDGGQWTTKTTVFEVPPAPENPQPSPENPSSVHEGSVSQGSLVVPRRSTETEERTSAPAVRNQRARDDVWEAMLAVCGVTSITPSARGAYNRACADLKAVGATPTEIGEHAQAFRLRWPDVSLTPTALARRWGETDPARQHAKVDPKADAVSAGVRAGVARAEAERAEKERAREQRLELS